MYNIMRVDAFKAADSDAGNVQPNGQDETSYEDIFDEYGNSVEAIAKHYCLPYVDFRGDGKVTIYSGSHPNANGHAYKAQKIYEQTRHLFQ